MRRENSAPPRRLHSIAAALAVSALAALPLRAHAQGTVEGRVVTRAGSPLSGVPVQIVGAGLATTTAPDGAFRLERVPGGEHVLRAAPDAHLEALSDVRVRDGEITRVTLRVAPDPASVTYRIDPITVTATRSEGRVSDAPASVSVVDGEELERLQPRTVDDVLRDLPNVTTVGGPRGQAELPTIRGFGADRIVLRVDGARQDFSSGHKGRLFLDPALLERVEVVRGPSSALYGNGAIGGVVSFRTVDAADLLQPGQSLAYSVTPRYRGEGDEWGGLGTVAGRTGEVDWLGSVSYGSSDDIGLSTGGELPFSGAETLSGRVEMGWEPGSGQRLEVSHHRFSEESTTPLDATSADSAQGQVADRSSLRQTTRVAYRARAPGDPWLDLDVTAYRNSSKVEEQRLSDGRDERRNVVTWGVDASNTSRLELSDRVSTSFTYGAEAYRDQSEGARDGGALESFPDGRADFTGLYVQSEWTFLDRIRLVPGLRWETYDQESAGAEPANEAEEVALKMAARVEATDFLSVYGSWGEGFNAPRLLDLYISGLHFPAPPGAPFPNNFFVSNPNLAPERSETWETGARFSLEHVVAEGDGLRAGLTYFRTDAEDFIAREVDTFGGVTTFENLDRVDSEGVEASVRYDAGVAFGGASYGQVRMRDLTADVPVADAPADTWVLDLGLRPAAGAFEVGYRGIFAEAQERVGDPALTTPGYGVSDLWAGWAASDGPLSGFSVQVRVDNVFDKAYRRHASFVPAPGRGLRLQVTRSGGIR